MMMEDLKMTKIGSNMSMQQLLLKIQPISCVEGTYIFVKCIKNKEYQKPLRSANIQTTVALNLHLCSTSSGHLQCVMTYCHDLPSCCMTFHYRWKEVSYVMVVQIIHVPFMST